MLVGVQAVEKGRLSFTASKVDCCCGLYVSSSRNPVGNDTNLPVYTAAVPVGPSLLLGAVGWKGDGRTSRGSTTCNPVAMHLRATSGWNPVVSFLEDVYIISSLVLLA